MATSTAIDTVADEKLSWATRFAFTCAANLVPSAAAFLEVKGAVLSLCASWLSVRIVLAQVSLKLHYTSDLGVTTAFVGAYAYDCVMHMPMVSCVYVCAQVCMHVSAFTTHIVWLTNTHRPRRRPAVCCGRVLRDNRRQAFACNCVPVSNIHDVHRNLIRQVQYTIWEAETLRRYFRSDNSGGALIQVSKLVCMRLVRVCMSIS
jgi:hypothetical protein